ncbi:beta-carotene ketolase (CrtW type) [Halomonas korlensis]|uniref:Beta-carotene ketolase (CrtW type) n=2 Tax=Halomonas korlensis TaxID=463301 RepID=A0A1I7IYL0_9GAMM|nr:beta-carotene ketolase (CrtW type) [Halomonas korlensis]
MTDGGRVMNAGAGTGVLLALLVLGSWAVVHVLAVFQLPLQGYGLVLAPVVIAVQCWLYVGLFIVAHDCMHGSLAPGNPRLNRRLGALCLWLYAAFPWQELRAAHFDHHRYVGTADDPDFDAAHPTAFLPWYVHFMRRYAGWRQPVFFGTVMGSYVLILGVPPANALLFIALPALLSSMQLFYFGTYRPHRHEATPFADRHHSRSSGYSWLLSLLSCFHFGYHHAHHLHPGVPWWQLPRVQGRTEA